MHLRQASGWGNNVLVGTFWRLKKATNRQQEESVSDVGMYFIVQLDDGDGNTEPNQNVFFKNTDGVNKRVKLSPPASKSGRYKQGYPGSPGL